MNVVTGTDHGRRDLLAQALGVLDAAAFEKTLAGPRRPGDFVSDYVTGHLARDFTGSVAPHAVANDEQAEASVDEVGILVVGADAADVGLSGDNEVHDHRN